MKYVSDATIPVGCLGLRLLSDLWEVWVEDLGALASDCPGLETWPSYTLALGWGSEQSLSLSELLSAH